MASYKRLTEELERLKASKLFNKADHDWIKFTEAVDEIVEAFGICSEAASKTLFGLIATGLVRALDKAEQVIDLDECTIAELEGKPKFVSASQLRSWLREWSAAPTGDRMRVIEAKLRSGQIPGRNIPWKQFCNDVRNDCNARLDAKGRPALGFSDKQIQRTVNGLRAK
jgi:hypothetical protein